MQYGHMEIRRSDAVIREGGVRGVGKQLWRQVFGGVAHQKNTPILNTSDDVKIAAAREAAKLLEIHLVDPEELQKAFRVAAEWNEAFCRDNAVGGQEERGIVAAALCWDVKALLTVLRWERRL